MLQPSARKFNCPSAEQREQETVTAKPEPPPLIFTPNGKPCTWIIQTSYSARRSIHSFEWRGLPPAGVWFFCARGSPPRFLHPHPPHKHPPDAPPAKTQPPPPCTPPPPT